MKPIATAGSKMVADRGTHVIKLFQLHEYLSLLPGVRRHDPAPFETQAARDEARALWPATGLAPWEAKPRHVEYAWISQDGSHTGHHIVADQKDCFVILVFETTSRTVVGYIMLDIGAEYAEIVYTCPPADFEGPAEEKILRETLPCLNRHEDAFAVLEARPGTYMQAYQNADGSYVLEHQLVTLKSHYQAVGPIGPEDVIAAFLSYAFGNKEWATQFKWERIDL